jgi:hypothetical protein
MTTSSLIWQNILPTSLAPELNFQLPSASPNAQRTSYELAAENGRSFKGVSFNTLKFRVPAINKFVDTHAGIRFQYEMEMGSGAPNVKDSHVQLNGDASVVISRLRVMTTSDQVLEDLNQYNLYQRLQSNATVPDYLRNSCLAICQGYSSGQASGSFEIPLHSGLLSNTKWLNLKWLSGLVIEITLAPVSEVIKCVGTAPNPTYNITNAALCFDAITLTDGQSLEMDSQWRKAGGVSFVHKSFKQKNPQFTTATGTIVISDRSASQAGFQMVFRSSASIDDPQRDTFELSKPIDSYHIRTGGSAVSLKPIYCPGTSIFRAYQELQKYYGGHSIGSALTPSRFGVVNPTDGTFMVCCDLETSSLVSGNSDAKRGNVDIQVDTTGPTFPDGVSYQCSVFVTYWQCIEFNVDGSVHVNS